VAFGRYAPAWHMGIAAGPAARAILGGLAVLQFGTWRVVRPA
jgi:hypothetical protein